MERGIWWLASYPKSGNTWMRMFLNSYIAGVPAAINSAYQVSQTDTHSPSYQATAAMPVSEIPKEHIMLYRPAALANMISLCRVRDPILKTHFANHIINGIPAIPDELTRGAIYIMRDPRDVAVSFSHHLNQSIDEVIELMVTPGARMKAHDSDLFYQLERWDEHVMSWEQHAFFVRYEDMLKDPKGMFGSVLDRMGIRIDHSRLDAAVKYSSFEKLKQQEEQHGFVEATFGKFFRQGQSGGWKDVLSHDQSNRIETEFSDVMQEYGYLCSNT